MTDFEIVSLADPVEARRAVALLAASQVHQRVPVMERAYSYSPTAADGDVVRTARAFERYIRDGE